MATPDHTTIPLTRGLFTVIDNIDSDLLAFKWNAKPDDRNVYATRSKKVSGKSKTILMHRIILSRVLGRELLSSEKVDHKDLNGLNNRRDNLRLATATQNAQNKRKQHNRAQLPKGVTKNGSRYQVYISVNGKQKYLGLYATPEIAGDVYKTAALEYFGEFAHF